PAFALLLFFHRIARPLRPRLFPTRRSSDLAFETFVPATKLLVYGDNLDFFRSLDVLVAAEKTSLLLKSRYGLRNLAMVYTAHGRSEEHTSELQSRENLVCRLLLEKKKKQNY